MKALLDTHTFLWWNMNDPQISEAAFDFISKGKNEIFFSAASAWEIAIKHARGRLVLPDSPDRYIPERLLSQDFRSLPVQISHALHVSILPEIHQDPFDRLLIAQSRLEGLPVLTSNEMIAKYEVEVIW